MIITGMVLGGLALIAGSHLGRRQAWRRRVVVGAAAGGARAAGSEAGGSPPTDAGPEPVEPVAICPAEPAVPSVVDAEVDQNLPLAVGSFGLAVAGTIWYPPLLLASLPGVVYNARYTFQSAYAHVVDKREVNVDVLNALIVGGFMASGHYVLGQFPLLLSSLRRRVVARVKDDSKGAITDVFRQQPSTARVMGVDGPLEIAAERLEVGDRVIVEAGEAVPVDGVIEWGAASVDQRMLTGESQPVELHPGDRVFALTMVCAGRIHVRVERAGEATVAARIGDILDNTVHAKTGRQLRSEGLVDRAMLPTLGLGLVSLPFIGLSSAWAILNAPPRDNLTIAGAVGIMTYLELLSRQGVLVKDGRIVELLLEVDTVVFDKTGTLTSDEPTVGRVVAVEGAPEAILRAAAGAEHRQSHPIARAIRRRAADDGLDVPVPEHAEMHLGHGVLVHLDGRRVRVGSGRFMTAEGLALPPALDPLRAECAATGSGLVFVAIDDRVAGAIELRPTARPEVRDVCAALRDRGLSLAIISGDHVAPTRHLADALGIDMVFAETLPEDKARIVDALQAEGRRVCFIGDGINDAIALKTAHVSVSLAGAASAATDTAQVVLMNGDLSGLPGLFDLADECRRTLDGTYGLITGPALLAMAGALFFGLGFVPALMLNQAGLLLGLLRATRPRLERRPLPALLAPIEPEIRAPSTIVDPAAFAPVIETPVTPTARTSAG